MHRFFGNSNIFKNFKKLGVVGGGGGREEKWGVSGEMIDGKKKHTCLQFSSSERRRGTKKSVTLGELNYLEICFFSGYGPPS